MEGNEFHILLIDVTFYRKHVWKLVFNLLIKLNNEYNGDRRLKG